MDDLFPIFLEGELWAGETCVADVALAYVDEPAGDGSWGGDMQYIGDLLHDGQVYELRLESGASVSIRITTSWVPGGRGVVLHYESEFVGVGSLPPFLRDHAEQEG